MVRLQTKLLRLHGSKFAKKKSWGIRTSVSPWNLRGLAFHGKSGFRISSFIPDMFGSGEHRFQMVLEKRDQPEWYNKINYYKELLHSEKELPKGHFKE